MQWRKRAAPSFFSSMRTLTSDQRLMVQEIAKQLERDPEAIHLQPIIYANGDYEVESGGVWVRYRINRHKGEIIFLRAEATM